MARVRIERKASFTVCGVSTWISGQNNQEFASFWAECNNNGICDKLKQSSSSPSCNVTHSRIMGISRVEKDPDKRTFDFYIASESSSVAGCKSFSVEGGQWAIFEGEGDSPEALIRAEMEAFMDWLPNSGYEHDLRPEIEVYPESTGVYVEFWLPIKNSVCRFGP